MCSRIVRVLWCVCVRARVYVCCLTSAIEIVLFFFLVRLIIVSLQKNEGYIYMHMYIKMKNKHITSSEHLKYSKIKL